MTRIAFIVDGVLEKKVVQRLCGDTPVRTTNLNGKAVEIAAIARAVSSLIYAFSNRHHPIVVVVDREQRQQSSADIEEEITRRLKEDGHDIDNIIVSCPDRMIENWICAGSRSYKGQSICQTANDDFDDSHGKSLIKRELTRIGIIYRETTIGVEMFASMQIKTAVDKSQSFARFVSKMTPYCPRIRSAIQ